MTAIQRRLLMVLAASQLLATAWAEPAWVSDQFEVMLRTGPSTSNAIERMLTSGTSLEVVERDRDAGYSKVRTAAGTEGWVLTRYLMTEPSAREQLTTLTNRLNSASAEGSSLSSQLASVNLEFDKATRTIERLEREKADLEKELNEIKRTAANVLSINNQNKTLRDEKQNLGITVDALELRNRELSSQSTRYWFMAGAAVLVFGMILGLWLPRIRWQKRSRYDRF